MGLCQFWATSLFLVEDKTLSLQLSYFFVFHFMVFFMEMLRSQPIFKFLIRCISLHHVNSGVLNAPCWLHKELVLQAPWIPFPQWWRLYNLMLQQSLGTQLHVPLGNPWIIFNKGSGMLHWTGLAVNLRLCWPSASFLGDFQTLLFLLESMSCFLLAHRLQKKEFLLQNEESGCRPEHKGLKVHPSCPPCFEVREIHKNFIMLYHLNLIKNCQSDNVCLLNGFSCTIWMLLSLSCFHLNCADDLFFVP